MNFDPCSDYYVSAYLNRPDVQEAMHANVTKLGHEWQPCSDVITKWNDSPVTIIPLLREFMKNGIRLWIFRYFLLFYTSLFDHWFHISFGINYTNGKFYLTLHLVL